MNNYKYLFVPKEGKPFQLLMDADWFGHKDLGTVVFSDMKFIVHNPWYYRLYRFFGGTILTKFKEI